MVVLMCSLSIYLLLYTMYNYYFILKKKTNSSMYMVDYFEGRNNSCFEDIANSIQIAYKAFFWCKL